MTLVATNVAARGLDINDVQLIIQVCLKLKVYFKIRYLLNHFFTENGFLLFSVNRHVMLKTIFTDLGGQEEQERLVLPLHFMSQGRQTFPS